MLAAYDEVTYEVPRVRWIMIVLVEVYRYVLKGQPWSNPLDH